MISESVVGTPVLSDCLRHTDVPTTDPLLKFTPMVDRNVILSETKNRSLTLRSTENRNQIKPETSLLP